MAAAAILDFQNFTFLTVGMVKKVELRHRSKFRRHYFNRDRGGRSPSWMCDASVATTHEGHLVVFITH